MKNIIQNMQKFVKIQTLVTFSKTTLDSFYSNASVIIIYHVYLRLTLLSVSAVHQPFYISICKQILDDFPISL